MPDDGKKALRLLAEKFMGKMLVAVDEDINIKDAENILWAIAYRAQPYRDTEVVEAPPFTLDPAAVPPGASRGLVTRDKPPRSTALLIDATMPWPYPPLSLPKREFMERAIEIWQGLQLPSLNLKDPVVGLFARPLDEGGGEGGGARRPGPPLRDRREAEAGTQAVRGVRSRMPLFRAFGDPVGCHPGQRVQRLESRDPIVQRTCSELGSPLSP